VSIGPTEVRPYSQVCLERVESRLPSVWNIMANISGLAGGRAGDYVTTGQDFAHAFCGGGLGGSAVAQLRAGEAPR
jgi:hypothetical protein